MRGGFVAAKTLTLGLQFVTLVINITAAALWMKEAWVPMIPSGVVYGTWRIM
jgi:hypothetical protein